MAAPKKATARKTASKPTAQARKASDAATAGDVAWQAADVPQVHPAAASWTAAPAQPRPAGMDDRQYTLLLHLSALAGLMVGGLFFLGPLILWLVRKEQSPFVDEHGREATNFHLSMLLYAVGAFVLFFAITVVTFGIGGLLLILPLMLAGLAWLVLSIVLPILAGMKANQGLGYRYPLTIRFIQPSPPRDAPPAQ